MVSFRSAATLGALLEQIDRMALLVDRLLSLAHTPAQIAAERMSRVDLAQLAERVVANMCPVMEERDQTLTLISVPAWTHTDEILVEQMLMDLLHNTSLYAPASSVVTLRVAANKGNSELASTGELLSNSSTSISISDAGSGPDRMWLERAGVKWQGQAPVNLLAESQVAHGTGLGLRFVARSMQLLGGSIHAEYLNNEKVNQGFSIILKWSVEVEPDWDEAAQVAPHFDADQRVSW